MKVKPGFDEMVVGHYATHPDVGGRKVPNFVAAATTDVGELRRKYDSLLALARRMRKELVFHATVSDTQYDDTAELLNESKWLEE